jgi:hypothetical protein
MGFFTFYKIRRSSHKSRVEVVLEWVEVEVEAVHEWEPMELLVEVGLVLEWVEVEPMELLAEVEAVLECLALAGTAVDGHGGVAVVVVVTVAACDEHGGGGGVVVEVVA